MDPEADWTLSLFFFFFYLVLPNSLSLTQSRCWSISHFDFITHSCCCFRWSFVADRRSITRRTHPEVSWTPHFPLYFILFFLLPCLSESAITHAPPISDLSIVSIPSLIHILVLGTSSSSIVDPSLPILSIWTPVAFLSIWYFVSNLVISKLN